MARGGELFQEAGVRVVALSFVALLAAIVLAWRPLVPVAAIAVGGLYGAELAIADAPLDVAVPAIAAGLFLCRRACVLVDRRARAVEGRSGRRHSGVPPFVALLAVAASLVAAALLTLVDAVRTTSLAVDLLGAAAAIGVFATIVALAGRGRGVT